MKTWIKPNTWNERSIVAIGDRVVVRVNGVLSAEVIEPKARKRGKLALQIHGGQDVDVRFKDVEIFELGNAE